jgi:hypothetical protein
MLLSLSVLVLSIAVVYAQVDDLGLRFIRIQQEKVHQQMLQGAAGNPWQYRILADLMLEPLIRLYTRMGFASPETLGFISFRYMQCLLILAAAALYYRKMGLGPIASLLGMSILTWSLSFSLYNSDLSFNVFFDVAFYLLAGWLILQKRMAIVALLMIPAAFNRETSLLIPVMLAAVAYFELPPNARPQSAMIAAAAGVLIYAIVFVGLRRYYGKQVFLTADGYYPGLQLLWLNIRRAITWEQLLATLGIVPVLAVLTYGRWPKPLRIFFWVIVPIWVGVHFAAALVAETRLMLVPQALVFIPGALFGIAAELKQPSAL